MADVFEAHDGQSGGRVALKILKGSVARDPEARSRFGHEARVQQMVRHPNVMVLHGAGISEGGYPYLVLELLRGRSLASLLKQSPRVPPRRAAGYAWQALQGLGATHAVGVLHRDLKPGNLMLEPTSGPIERVVVIDFGFAALDGSTGLTRQGFVVGSLSYMAPERLRGEPPDPRSDLYSLGIVLYELLTGKRPFHGENDSALVMGHLDETPAPPSRMAPDAGIPSAMDMVVMKALSKHPEERAASAHAMAKELEAALSSG